MKAFARTADSLARHPGKLEKIALLAEYFSSLDDADLLAAARFFTGTPFAARDQRTLSLGGRSIVAAAQRAWGFGGEDLSAGYREHGDLGAALGPLVAPPADLALFSETLRPASLLALFEQIATVAGKSAGRKREALCERILGACTEPLEATYVVKILTGDLRVGLREGLVVEAIARAFGETTDAVRRANMASGDIGAVAVAARAGTLAHIRIAFGTPIGFMLASPIAYGSEYGELAGGRWVCEDKYDGIRAQLHKWGDRIALFSRTLNDVTHSYPEILQAALAIQGDVMLDGEIIARRDGRVLPFRYLQARLQRKNVDPALLTEVPVVFVAFDMLARGDDFLIDESLLARRALLADISVPGRRLEISSFAHVESAMAAGAIEQQFDDARARGHEGIVLKRADAPYYPGRRGKWWLKLKKELSTLDVVVVAVQWGHGKRAKVLSDYTFAVRGRNGELLTIGKAYSGLTDREIAELTPWFLA
ncbi:MAG: DNA ligase, partial [Candidatus Eremiobacteraeota bacterium]|nr:DNA ligase [Candidatus Eremiobacteraeota bacterium]